MKFTDQASATRFRSLAAALSAARHHLPGKRYSAGTVVDGGKKAYVVGVILDPQARFCDAYLALAPKDKCYPIR